MQIDTNTIVLTLLALATGYFAVGYVRQRMEAKFTHLQTSINENRDIMWRSVDDVTERLERLERRVDCCSKQSACNKQGSASY